MQNFGRGMWRRVGDYERIQKPILLQQSRLEQWQQFIQHQQAYKQHILKPEPKPEPKDTIVQLDLSIDHNKVVLIEENNQPQDIDTPELQQDVSEPPVVIPKKTKRKNKNK